MPRYPYQFTGRILIEKWEMGTTMKLYLPDDIAEKLPLKKHPRLRVEALLDGHRKSAAWQPTKEGHYMMISRAFLKEAGINPEHEVEVKFRIVDQNRVEIPDDLREALAREPDLKAAWEQITPGKRRGLAHYIDSGKTRPTRDKRIAALLKDLRAASDETRPPHLR